MVRINLLPDQDPKDWILLKKSLGCWFYLPVCHYSLGKAGGQFKISSGWNFFSPIVLI